MTGDGSGRVVIVGGGVLGAMHALAARRRGLAVTHLEREAGTRGASVRNFGLVWVGGRAGGAELDLALRARELWGGIGAAVPALGFRANGSLTVASDDAERALLEQAANRPDAELRGFRLLEPDEVTGVAPTVTGPTRGALLCRADAAVEPRLVPAALRAHLVAGGDYTWLPRTEAVELDDHAVRDQHGTWHRGDLVVLATGAAHTGLAGAHLADAGVRRVRLQMLQTAPDPRRHTTSLADGDSLRYYPVFDLPGLADLPPQNAVGAHWRSQLLLVQRLDGSLTIGDTHAYDEPFPFDVEEEPYDDLRARASALLGGALPPTLRRWAGVYSQVVGTDRVYHRGRLAPGVEVVTGLGGRGMTCSPAVAEETLTAAWPELEPTPLPAEIGRP